MSSKKRLKVYYKIYISSILLIIIGSTIVLSSSVGYALLKNVNPTYYFIKQIIWLIFGIIGIFLLNKIGIKNIEKYSILFLLFSIFLSFIPIITGNLRWIRIGPLSFQPAELLKLSFVIYLSDYLKRKRKTINELKTLIVPFGFFLFITGILQLQKDLGTFIIIFFTVSLLLFLGGLSKKYFFLMISIGIALLPLLIIIFPYRIERIKIFLNPSIDPNGKGYQIFQSKIALGSGGLFGKGIGFGKQKLNYLPEAHKDYVFAIVGEEMGFVGTSFILFLFYNLIFSGFEISRRAKDEFEKFVTSGISALLGIQFFLHVSVVLSLIPSKGTTLPFFSVGGSSLLANMLSLGILLIVGKNVCFLTPKEELETFTFNEPTKLVY